MQTIIIIILLVVIIAQQWLSIIMTMKKMKKEDEEMTLELTSGKDILAHAAARKLVCSIVPSSFDHTYLLVSNEGDHQQVIISFKSWAPGSKKEQQVLKEIKEKIDEYAESKADEIKERELDDIEKQNHFSKGIENAEIE